MGTALIDANDAAADTHALVADLLAHVTETRDEAADDHVVAARVLTDAALDRLDDA